MRRAAKVDGNQAKIVDALRACGATVWYIKLPVDLLVGFRGQTVLMEVKDGDKPPSARKHTPLQTSFLGTWNGGTVATVCDVESALRALRVL